MVRTWLMRQFRSLDLYFYFFWGHFRCKFSGHQIVEICHSYHKEDIKLLEIMYYLDLLVLFILYIPPGHKPTGQILC